MADCEDRLHAVRSGLAGLAGAIHVLTEQGDDLPEASRLRVESLLVAEVERLQRLAAPEPLVDRPRGLEHVDVDHLVGDVVLSRRMAGQEVAWSPSGQVATGRGDELAEVLQILLVNAWRHAGGALARIEVTGDGARVRIVVSDDGPGVPEELRGSIFERGVRRAYSPGQGLGLAMARELMTRLGGSILLVDRSEGGARFELTLPAAALDGAA